MDGRFDSYNPAFRRYATIFCFLDICNAEEDVAECAASSPDVISVITRGG
jgi:hypothetical protein